MINVDMVPVRDETEALVLMLHHLRLAAMYFEATPEKYPHGFFDDEWSKLPMKRWVDEMEQLYPNGEETTK